MKKKQEKHQHKGTIGLFKRVDVNEEDFFQYGSRFQKAYVSKKIANDLKPSQIKHELNTVDQVYAQLFKGASK